MSSKRKNRAAGARAAKGKCRLCQQVFGSKLIEEHLNKCLESKFPPPADDNKSKYFLVKAYSQVYWLYLKAPATATLQDIDNLLRRIWLECCGHMSTFNRALPPLPKGKKPTMEDLMPPKANSDEMDEDTFSLRKSLTLGKVAIDVMAEKFGPRSNDKTITILARNNHPMLDCSKCNETAKKICSECFEVFCSKHSKHGCDSEMSLPMANSPRCGSCGYTGNNQDEGDKLPQTKEAVNVDELSEEEEVDEEEEEEEFDEF